MKILKGSERKPAPGATDLGSADPRERLESTLLVRRRNADAFTARMRAVHAGESPDGFLSREAYAEQFGADPADIAAVERYAAANGLAVVASDLAARTVTVSGTVRQFETAFGVQLRRMQHPGGAWRGRTGAVHLPVDLSGVVEAVLGLDNRPQARAHFRIAGRETTAVARAGAAAASFTPGQLAQLYNFPAGTGAGECIAIIELGGGYKPADLDAYFAAAGISPSPQVIAVSVDHGRNAPTGSANGPDGEVMLDVEVVGAVAPGATIAVYFAPNTDAGFLDALTTAVHDATNKPSVISISWGGPESSWTAQAMAAFDQALQSAAVMGVTVAAACGDSGSTDGVASGEHVDFPASSPHALACGGTSIKASSGKISAEKVWDELARGGGATGGGISSVFATPAWQRSLAAAKTSGPPAPLTGRGVPDISADADPQTGYQVRVDGQDMVIGGTSAVAPLWAALIARINAAAGKPVGLIQPKLYAHPAALRDIRSGNNGDFTAAPGWDACTGLGSPDGVKVAGALR